MENSTQNKINCFDAMRDVLADADYTEAIDSNEGFKDEAEAFRDTCAVMQPFLQKATGKTHGVTLNKKRVRESRIKKAVELTSGGFAFARKVGNSELESEMNMTKSAWKELRGVNAHLLVALRLRDSRPGGSWKDSGSPPSGPAQLGNRTRSRIVPRIEEAANAPFCRWRLAGMARRGVNATPTL